MHPHLQRLQRELLGSVGVLSGSETQAGPRDRPEAWNVQAIVEHLLLTYKSTASMIEERIAKGRPVQTPITLRNRVAQFAVISLGRFPRRAEAPSATVAPRIALARSGDELARRASDELNRLDEVCHAAEALFGAKRAVTHFRLGPLSIAQWRKFHLVHGRHHVAQIRAICREHEFVRSKIAGA